MQRHIFFGPAPWGGAKRSNIIKYHKISITQSISKIFKPNFVYLLTNERFKTYQRGFSFGRLGHVPGVGLGGTVGGWVIKKIFPEIQPNLVCELLTSMAHAAAQLFWSPPPWAQGRGQTVKYQKISMTKSISKIFQPNFVCLLTNERYKTYQKGFSFGRLGHTPGVGLGGTVGVGWSKKIFSPKFNQIRW